MLKVDLKISDLLREQGYALLRGVISFSESEELCRKIDKLSQGHWDTAPPTEQFHCVFNREDYWLRFLDKEPIITEIESFLGFNCHIIGQTAWRTHPGHIGSKMHVDYLPFIHNGRVEVPPFIITAHYYANDVTQDLAPTWVVPKSHKSGKLPDANFYQENKAFPVLCSAGDVLLFRSDLWHSGSPNTTNSIRYLLQVHYAQRCIAQHFHPFINWVWNQDVLSACNSRQRRLLGDHRRGNYD